jgi:hypothetical protein
MLVFLAIDIALFMIWILNIWNHEGLGGIIVWISLIIIFLGLIGALMRFFESEKKPQKTTNLPPPPP